MLHNTFCLALWRLPAASAAASSISASASSPAPTSTAPLDPAAATSSAANSASAPASRLSTPAAATSAKPSAKLLAEPSAHVSGRPGHKGASHLQSQSNHTPAAICEDADAVLLAFTYPRYRIYSIARSPDGRFVAVGQSLFLTTVM